MAIGMEDFENDESPPANSSQRPITEENTPEESGQTLHIPMEFIQGAQLKEGDELVLKIVSSSEDGLEVAYAPKSDDEESTEGANEQIDSINDGY